MFIDVELQVKEDREVKIFLTGQSRTVVKQIE